MILVLKTKHEDVMVCARNDVETRRAYLYLFQVACDNEYYSYEDALTKNEAELYEAAIRGDASAARRLLLYRSQQGYEYEIIKRINPIEP